MSQEVDQRFLYLLKSSDSYTRYAWSEPCYSNVMSRYGIATIFENPTVGYEFTPNNIPLHLTHVDSFTVDLSPEQLSEKLNIVLTNQKLIQVKALRDAYYGPNKDIPVTELELTPSLVKLHKAIMDMLAAQGALLKNPQFHNDGFSPHISIYGSRRFTVGDLITIGQLSIGAKVSDADDANTKILATIEFRG
jgi:hypothetical protein